MSKKIIRFNPAILKKKKSIKEYTGYSQSFAFKINKLSSRLKRYTVRKFRKYDLGNPELVVISLIGQIKEKLTIKDLSTVHWMDKTLISRASIRLLQMKILKKTNSETDKRSHYLELTNKGRKIFEELKNAKKNRYTKLVKDLSESEVIQLNILLDKITSNSEINLIK